MSTAARALGADVALAPRSQGLARQNESRGGRNEDVDS
jgi:hypothetical protein